MMAQQRGVSLDEYARTTSFQEFTGEVSAWYTATMTPLNTLMQAFSGGSSGSAGSPATGTAPASRRMAEMKQKYAGKKANFHDLDTRDGQLRLIHGEKATGLKLLKEAPKAPNRKPTAKRLF